MPFLTEGWFGACPPIHSSASNGGKRPWVLAGGRTMFSIRCFRWEVARKLVVQYESMRRLSRGVLPVVCRSGHRGGYPADSAGTSTEFLGLCLPLGRSRGQDRAELRPAFSFCGRTPNTLCRVFNALREPNVSPNVEVPVSCGGTSDGRTPDGHGPLRDLRVASVRVPGLPHEIQ